MSQRLAAIEYVGVAGVSRECMDAVLRLLQYGDEVKYARILSRGQDHCLLLTVNAGDDLIAVKSGFASGYGGQGPRTLSQVLALLHNFGVKINEYDVSPEVMDRVDESALTDSDITDIESARPVQPSRWYDYVYEDHWQTETNHVLFQEFPPVIPFAIIDSRILDLAISFWKRPDEKLMTGYRRLEDLVRTRTGLDEHGTKLFSLAFVGEKSKLY